MVRKGNHTSCHMQICNYENYDVLHPDAQPGAAVLAVPLTPADHQQLPQLSLEVGELLLLQLGLAGELLPCALHALQPRPPSRPRGWVPSPFAGTPGPRRLSSLPPGSGWRHGSAAARTLSAPRYHLKQGSSIFTKSRYWNCSKALGTISVSLSELKNPTSRISYICSFELSRIPLIILRQHGYLCSS